MSEKTIEDKKIGIFIKGNQLSKNTIDLYEKIKIYKVPIFWFTCRNILSDFENEKDNLYREFYIPYREDVNSTIASLVNAKDVKNSETSQVERVDLGSKILFAIYTTELSGQRAYNEELFKKIENKLHDFRSEINNRTNLVISFSAVVISLIALFSGGIANNYQSHRDTIRFHDHSVYFYR